MAQCGLSQLPPDPAEATTISGLPLAPTGSHKQSKEKADQSHYGNLYQVATEPTPPEAGFRSYRTLPANPISSTHKGWFQQVHKAAGENLTVKVNLDIAAHILWSWPILTDSRPKSQ